VIRTDASDFAARTRETLLLAPVHGPDRLDAGDAAQLYISR
jgi:hypothetical protein